MQKMQKPIKVIAFRLNLPTHYSDLRNLYITFANRAFTKRKIRYILFLFVFLTGASVDISSNVLINGLNYWARKPYYQETLSVPHLTDFTWVSIRLTSLKGFIKFKCLVFSQVRPTG